MQEQEEICDGDSDSVLGRVRDIRRKWAVQEDEALAYRLQDEEIAQHYNSNRTRNAIVREDVPRAREAQRQEDLQALEERLKHLNLLQKQAEEDARLAKLLATRDSEASKVKKAQPPIPLSPNNGHSRYEKPTSPLILSPNLSPQEFLQQHVTSEVVNSAHLKRTKSPLLGAAAASSSMATTSSASGPLPQPVKLADVPGPSRLYYSNNGAARRQEIEQEDEDDFTEDDLRKFQEDRDAAMARKLQEEIDKTEKDKLLALEAQDRELAKMLHDKERARYRRAKEKARMKAEAMAAAAATGGGGSMIPGEGGEILPPEGSEVIRAASRNSSSSERSRSVMSGEVVMMIPAPKLPEKQRSPTGDHIGFRANPKPLPPHPSSLHIPEYGSSMAMSQGPSPQYHHLHHHQQHPIEQHHRIDPVPPYMPIHGYNRNSPKRHK